MVDEWRGTAQMGKQWRVTTIFRSGSVVGVPVVQTCIHKPQAHTDTTRILYTQSVQQHTETSLLTADRIFRAFRPTQTHTELSENRNCFNQGFGASSALLLEQITSWTTYMRSTLAHSDAHTDTLKHTFTSAHMHTS